jgi:hypothetical protein
MYRRGGHETGEGMTGHSTTSGITMQQSPGIRARQRMAAASPGVCIAAAAAAAAVPSSHPIPSHRKPDRCCVASRTRFQLGPPPLANRSHVRVRVPEHVARWLWLQLGPRRLAACVASAPELRDRTLFVSSVRVDSGQCSDVLLSPAQLLVQSMGVGVEAVAVVHS